jgi:hypothetical protein
MRHLPVPVLLWLAALLVPASAQDAAPFDLRGEFAITDGPSFFTDETMDEPIVLDDGEEAADETGDGDAAPKPKARPAETDPYAPLGIRAGGFILFPSVEGTTGYTTNADGVAGGKPSGLWTVTPELDIRSDWAEHEARLLLRGSYEAFTDGVTQAEPSATVRGEGRVDLPGEWSLEGLAGYDYALQSVSDPNFPAGVDEAPGVHDLIATAALSGGAGRVKLTLGASVERTIYENGMSGGMLVDQGDRTNNLFGGRVRLGYELTPSITPFVEGVFTRRLFDRAVDDDGIRRASTGSGVRAGIAFDRGPILGGEIAVGARREDFDDPVLADLQALTVDGSLVWSPTRLVTVTLAAATGIEPSTDPLSSGSVIHDASVEVAYNWRRNVTVLAAAGVNHETFQGIGLDETTWSAGGGLVWKLNRSLHLTLTYLHEWLDSSAPDSDFQSDTVTVGLKVQR